MADYEDILNMSWDEIPEPKVLPVGSYLLRGRNASYQPAKSADASPAVLFVYTPKEAMDDVSEEELAALGPDYDMSANRIFARFFVSDGADWANVRKHLAKHGIEATGNIKETLKQFQGREVIAYLGQKTFTDNAGELKVDNNPTNFVPVEG